MRVHLTRISSLLALQLAVLSGIIYQVGLWPVET